MKNKTRKGLTVVIDEKLFIKQQKITINGRLYFKAMRRDGATFEFEQMIPGVAVEIYQEPSQAVDKGTYIPYNPPRGIDPSKCPSAGGAFVATKAIDKFSSQKYQGEVFFTHKTSPGLIIKKDGRIIHDTKMEDMYKRR